MIGTRAVFTGAFPDAAPRTPEDTMRGTSVKRTTNWSTAADNDTVPFDTEEYDDDGIWTVSAPTILGPMPALYDGKRAVIYATAIWSGGSAYKELKVFRNGVIDYPIAVVQVAHTAGNVGVELTSRPIVLATDDEFALCARSGDAATALYADDYSITFSIEVRGV